MRNFRCAYYKEYLSLEKWSLPARLYRSGLALNKAGRWNNLVELVGACLESCSYCKGSGAGKLQLEG